MHSSVAVDAFTSSRAMPLLSRLGVINLVVQRCSIITSGVV
jgi:hypothetical protein